MREKKTRKRLLPPTILLRPHTDPVRGQYVSYLKKVEESSLQLGYFETDKRRISASLMLKSKAALVSALDEAKANADNQAKERVSLLSKYRNMEQAAEGLKENFDEEVGAKALCQS